MSEANLATSSNVVHFGPALGRLSCLCHHQAGSCQLIAITGGPGAGKTAILNLAQNMLCRHIAFVPESATIIFSGGFWRPSSNVGLAAAQTAIYHVQRQLELYLIKEGKAMVGLCDRGTVDGVAYWPADHHDYWRAMGTTRDKEINRYKAVIHLRSPQLGEGYDKSNPQRIESAERAAEIDEAIFNAWKNHPNRTVIEAEASFSSKIDRTMAAIFEHIPKCCHSNLG